jgi:hypothetical protein
VAHYGFCAVNSPWRSRAAVTWQCAHGSLARRLELWCAAAPERQYLALLRSGLWHLLANNYAATYLDASFLAAISARCRSVGRMRNVSLNCSGVSGR